MLKKIKTVLNRDLFFYIPFVLLSLISCTTDKRQIKETTPFDKKVVAAGIVNKDSNTAPFTILISAANAPVIIKAGKPVTINNPFANGMGYPVLTNYSTEQGLALSSVNCGLKDKKGNLWFGTNGGGVSKYDGKKFKSFTAAQGLANNSVNSILEDKKGDLWFGMQDGGVSKYDGKTFTNYTTVQGLANNSVWSIAEDKTGNKWFGTNGGVSKFDGVRFTNYTMEQGLPNNTIWSIIEDTKGNLWFGTDGGASKYDGKNFTNYTTAEGLAANFLNCIREDKEGNLWFGTPGGGVSKYDGKTFTTYTTGQGLANNKVWSIAEDNAGHLWFGTNDGVSKYDGNYFTNYTSAQGLINNGVMNITEDNAGNLWFGTSGGGVSRYDGESFTNYTPSLGLISSLVFSIAEDKTGNLWFGIIGGVSKYDGKTFTNYTAAQGLVNNFVFSIKEDRFGNMWFGTNGGGVSKYDGKNFTNYTTAQGLAHNRVMDITEDKSGNMWFGTNGGGVSKYDGKSFTNYTTAQGLASNSVRSMLEDKAGNLWFATLGGGVSKYDGKQFTNYTTAQGLANNQVWCIKEDRSGNLWFGTPGGGVSKYDGKTFTNYTTAEGLADDVVYAMAEDTVSNKLWFGTNLGLSGLQLSSTEKTDSSTATQPVKFENFNNSTGYPVKDLNINALLLDSKGILWAGCGDNKLIRFDYKALNKNTAPLSLQIQGVSINNENICWSNLLYTDGNIKSSNSKDSLILIHEMISTFGRSLSGNVLDSMKKRFAGIQFDSISSFNFIPQNLVLPYNHNNISFEFAAIEPAMPGQVKYQYMLEGYTKDWSPWSNKTEAVFGNISEGSYTFKLRAISPFGIQSAETYTFKVLPPWYRTWWAYLLYTIFSLLILYGFIRWRTQKLNTEKIVLEEKVTLRTHQLQEEKEKVETALTELKSTQAQLVQREKMASLGELTAGIAHEIQNPLNFVNNFSEVSNELIDEMKLELKNGNKEEANSIASEIKQNLEKINQHGKRADAIIKGMLQHSRSSTGQKELTDINALANEYLRLSYHGLRAKDKSFEAAMATDFDESIGKITIIPQDIGRVLLNLYNNAFYAVAEKKKQKTVGYEPIVSVSTKAIKPPPGGGGFVVEIRVKDNGHGIPQKIVDKIFQPFFTTKPTGQGTGLGLSLSYDIVKAHGGELSVRTPLEKVETKEEEGSEFIILIPFS